MGKDRLYAGNVWKGPALINRQDLFVISGATRTQTINVLESLKTVFSRKWVAHSHCHLEAAKASSDLGEGAFFSILYPSKQQSDRWPGDWTRAGREADNGKAESFGKSHNLKDPNSNLILVPRLSNYFIFLGLGFLLLKWNCLAKWSLSAFKS